MNFTDSKISQIIEQTEVILNSDKNKDEKLLAICQLLDNEVEYYDWTGFYMVVDEPNMLVLGPYVGDSTDHTHIAFGDGICGQAADSKETYVIQDVTKESNYLSCSINVKSEIVVPIMKDGIVLGELDIDSHKSSPFDNSDNKLLEKIADMLATLL